MPIHRLPQHLINKLKAGEIVERPASLVKELLENALDAGATELQIWIEEGGKKLIKIQDNGSGISYEDLPLVLERYATSKIITEEDLEHITSYGFRGEALASISEVSNCTLQTRTKNKASRTKHQEEQQDFGFQLQKIHGEIIIEPMSLSYEHGTTVVIQDVFANIPARYKYLKSDTTERGYIHSLLLDYLLIHHQKSWKLWHNGKLIWNVEPQNLMERVAEMFNKDWLKNLAPFERSDGIHSIYGVTSRATLHFGSPNYIHIFVNGRPVTDKIIKKAILESYTRQLVPGTYPCTVLFLDIKSNLVDVNVHPRKTEVKFLDPKSIFTIVKNTIDEQIGNQKVSYAHFNKQTIRNQYSGNSYTPQNTEIERWNHFQQQNNTQQKSGYHGLFDETSFHGNEKFSSHAQQTTIIIEGDSYRIISQLRNMYILLQGDDGILLVDQHGTAIVVLAGLINALKVTNKIMSDIKIVMTGAGAAGIAIAKLLWKAGAKNIIMIDTKGAIHHGRTDLNKYKQQIADYNRDNLSGSLSEVIVGADVFIGVSGPGTLNQDMVRSMSTNAIVFGLANPIPEIMPEDAHAAGAAIVATGRSDYPNQINNVLAFPGLFKGILAARIPQITDDHKLAAAFALANYVTNPTVEMIIPDALDKGVADVVANAVMSIK